MDKISLFNFPRRGDCTYSHYLLSLVPKPEAIESDSINNKLTKANHFIRENIEQFK